MILRLINKMLHEKKKISEKNNFLPYEIAHKYVRSLGLKGRNEWRAYCVRGTKPIDIPSVPHLAYKEFISYEDWTGGTKRPKYKEFEEERTFARSLNFKNWAEWVEFSKSNKRPLNVPTNPEQAYKGKFISRGDWLGTDSLHWRYYTWRPFLEARTYVHSLELKGYLGWKKYCKSGMKPKDIPAAPYRLYKEWVDYEDWTGYLTKSKFRSFEDARTFVRKLGLNNMNEYFVSRRNGQIPKDIPSNPRRTYKDKYISTRDWLGTSKFAKS